jgi:hypothetical protein
MVLIVAGTLSSQTYPQEQANKSVSRFSTIFFTPKLGHQTALTQCGTHESGLRRTEYR